MSLIISVAFFAAVLLASGTSSANQSDWTRARLACADVGIDPNSAAFDQCVFDLYYSVWDEQNVFER
jgi:hypothetical protein